MIESSLCYTKKTHFRKITKTKNNNHNLQSLKLNNYIFSTIAILILLLTILSIVGLIFYIFSTILQDKSQDKDLENIIDILHLKHLLKLQLSKSVTPYNIV